MQVSETIASVLAFLIVLSFLLPQAYASLYTAKAKYKTKDTRTKVIDELNALKDVKKVIIAKELRLHSQDLKRLNIPYHIAPLFVISSSASTKVRTKDTIYLLPKKITSRHLARNKKQVESMQKIIDNIDQSLIIETIGGNGGMRIKQFSINPGMILVKDLPIMSTEIIVNKPFKIDFTMCEMSKPYKGSPLGMLWSGSVTTPVYALSKDSYSLIVNAKGTKAFEEYAKLKIQVFSSNKDKSSLIVEKIVETKQDFTNFNLLFELKQDDNVSFIVSFINDKSRAKPKEDRNAYLKSIILKRQ